MKNNPSYKTPDNYFEGLKSDILQKTVESKQVNKKAPKMDKKPRFWVHYASVGTVAASVLFGGFFFGKYYKEKRMLATEQKVEEVLMDTYFLEEENYSQNYLDFSQEETIYISEVFMYE